MRLSDYFTGALANAKVELFQVESSNLSPMHLQWLRDPHVGKFLEARFQEHSTETLLNFVKECEASKTVLLLGIRRVDNQQYVGNIILNWDPNHGVGDIGIMIGDIPSWGRGLAGAAISLMCKLGFGFVGLRKIMAGAYASNMGSIRAFERNGFKVEATFVDHVLQDGNPDSVCMMRLFESEYVELDASEINPDISAQTIHDEWQVQVAKALQRVELDGRCIREDMSVWRQVWDAMPYQPVATQRRMVDYQHDYYLGLGWIVLDASLVIHHDAKPVGLWLLTLGRYKGKTTLSSAGVHLMPPMLLPGLSTKTVKTLCNKTLAVLQQICRALQIPMPPMQWPVLPGLSNGGLSEWQQQLLRNGVLPSTRYELFVDLQRPMPEIRNSFRKSYKSLINKGLDLFVNEVIDESLITPDIWSEFKSLHLEVAGRSTRAESTWDSQCEMIRAGQAFLVTVRDKDTARLVGAGFFQHTRDEGLYAVAAYDRTLFDKPIGHAVQQLAIERMKILGLKWYRIGERRYAQEMPPPSPKEVAIGEFKHGFASHEFVRQEYRWPIGSIAEQE